MVALRDELARRPTQEAFDNVHKVVSDGVKGLEDEIFKASASSP
jgi:hypothetical protein